MSFIEEQLAKSNKRLSEYRQQRAKLLVEVRELEFLIRDELETIQSLERGQHSTSQWVASE